jgi:hypothetical protein
MEHIDRYYVDAHTWREVRWLPALFLLPPKESNGTRPAGLFLGGDRLGPAHYTTVYLLRCTLLVQPSSPSLIASGNAMRALGPFFFFFLVGSH